METFDARGKGPRRALCATLFLAAVVAFGFARCSSHGAPHPQQPDNTLEVAAAPPPTFAPAADLASANGSEPFIAASPPTLAAGSPSGATSTTMDPDSTMQQLRAELETNPRLVESLARELRRQFPDGKDADERDAILVGAVYNQRKFGVAKAEGQYYVKHHPQGQFLKYVAVLTGMHFNPPQ